MLGIDGATKLPHVRVTRSPHVPAVAEFPTPRQSSSVVWSPPRSGSGVWRTTSDAGFRFATLLNCFALPVHTPLLPDAYYMAVSPVRCRVMHARMFPVDVLCCASRWVHSTLVRDCKVQLGYHLCAMVTSACLHACCGRCGLTICTFERSPICHGVKQHPLSDPL